MSIDDPLRLLLRHPEVAALYDYWSARRDKEEIPLRDAFFRPELERWGRSVVLIRAKQNANMSYGFYGANFKEAFGLDMTGASLLQEIKKRSPGTEVIVISEQDKIDTALQLLKAGA
mgnify:CR=1 FL=1